MHVLRLLQLRLSPHPNRHIAHLLSNNPLNILDEWQCNNCTPYPFEPRPYLDRARLEGFRHVALSWFVSVLGGAVVSLLSA